MLDTYAKPSRNFTHSLGQLPTDYSYLMIFHLSRNNLGYLLKWAEMLPLLGVISIPYSENAEVKAILSKHTDVYSPSLEQIPAYIADICRQHQSKKIILVEIGGYSVLVAGGLPNVVLSVEDTTRGHIRFQENEQKLRYPVVSIARTAGKKLEDDAVGKAIIESTELTLTRMGRRIADEHVTVLGYGGVGQGAARHLQPRAKHVMAYDPDIEASQKAITDGFDCPGRLEAISQASVIVGCSGYQSIRPDDIGILKDKALLISGSSRQVEFPYDYFQSYISSNSSGQLLERCSYNHKSFDIAYKAQPINFFFDIGLGEVFDIPMTLLAQSVTYGLNNNLKPKLYSLPEST